MATGVGLAAMCCEEYLISTVQLPDLVGISDTKKGWRGGREEIAREKNRGTKKKKGKTTWFSSSY